MPEPYDVAIIGAGPVGLSFANSLGKLGRSVVLIEKECEEYSLPRAVTFDDEVMRIFQSFDLEEEILNITDLGGDSEFIDGDGNVLVKWERPRQPHSGQSRFAQRRDQIGVNHHDPVQHQRFQRQGPRHGVDGPDVGGGGHVRLLSWSAWNGTSPPWRLVFQM